jgi:hypothetical protein
MHTFQIPFGILELQPSDNANVTWVASDSSKVSISPGTVDFGTGSAYASAMVTTQGVGDTWIVATKGTQCGAAILHISQSSDDDWKIGNDRYNNGTLLQRVGNGQLAHLDGGAQAACTNCHGPNATMASYATVEHTPEQTGGFSDDDLVGIFTMGMVPPGGYFDNSIVRQQTWARFHQWDMTSDEQKGVVVYLRSLTPAPQKGMANLPPRTYDGGRGPGGGDGGGPGPGPGDDASTPDDSGTGTGGEAATGDDSSTQGDVATE